MDANFAPEIRCAFTDAKAVHHIRGDPEKSYRLIIEAIGIMDFIEVSGTVDGGSSGRVVVLDINGAALWCPDVIVNTHIFELTITLSRSGHFEVVADSSAVVGHLKPLPPIESQDISAVKEWIASKHIPYQNIPNVPGKTKDFIKRRATRLFPFQDEQALYLGMCIYDWTTPSFARMELLKALEYTGLAQRPLHPFDEFSLAKAIWDSSDEDFTPQNEDYMRSFMMKPTNSLNDVKVQLDRGSVALQHLNDVENRVLSAAIDLLPRTSVAFCPQLFSGQGFFGIERFGVYFHECPLNNGPKGTELAIPFEEAMETFLAPGKTITTKSVLSCTDSRLEALCKAQGILIVLNPKPGAHVWNAPFITPLSCDPEKIEFVFKAESKFKVESYSRMVNHLTGRSIMVMTLQAL
ncbi:hypothetical protein QBC38DRAFT_417069 [Podospora fimiseda]|uniref:Uncharacterized protein n=1 Tax=Podospora fimiseda TaxID=252190 RepID=A0AAN7BPW5_9PEZI|nr:hypothetical protein QBC38DRAFT_417069 [Podospora fimiseda]